MQHDSHVQEWAFLAVGQQTRDSNIISQVGVSAPYGDDTMKPEDAKAFIEAIKKLAFEMPPPNAYTPRFVEMCIWAERKLHEHQTQTAAK